MDSLWSPHIIHSIYVKRVINVMSCNICNKYQHYYHSYTIYRESYWCYQIPTPGVSLGVLSPQGRQSPTFTEHMPNEWTAYSDATILPRKVSFQTPTKGSSHSPHVLANHILCELVLTQGLEPQILCWETSVHKDYTTTIGNKRTQLMSSDWI